MSTPRNAETDAFAQRLREIRDGSGRSYGALARRVGVSASTLHRYCSGSTVPVEFAPIERLARLCGYEADELIALHRLWVRADIERRRRQEAGAGTGSGAGVDAEVQAQSQVEAEVGSPSTADAQPGTDPAPGPLTVPPPPPPPDAPPPARRRLLRRTSYSAAALAAAVLALVLLLAFDRSPLSTADRRRASAQPSDGHGTGAPLSPDGGITSGVSPDPTATTTGNSTAPGRDPRPGGTEQPKSPGPGSTAGEKPSRTPHSDNGGTSTNNNSGIPFTWSTNRYVWEGGCGHAFLVDRAPSAVPPPPAESDAEPWARSVGAVDAGESGVRVTVQGRSDTAVVLQALHVRLAARRTPLPYNAYSMSPGCGGSLTPRLFDINLDSSRPVARSRAGNDAGEPIPAVSFPYRVSADDPEILLATARTVTCDCEWYLELEWSSGGRSGTVRVDDNGKPFRTSGLRGRPVHEYDTGSHRWIPAGPTLAADPAEEADKPRTEPRTEPQDTPRNTPREQS